MEHLQRRPPAKGTETSIACCDGPVARQKNIEMALTSPRRPLL